MQESTMHAGNNGRQQPEQNREGWEKKDIYGSQQSQHTPGEEENSSPAVVEHSFVRPQEVTEQLIPLPGNALPVQAEMDGIIMAEQKKIDRVFYYLVFVTGACLAAVVVSPRPEVRLVAFGIWSGSAALARYLLRRSYR
jgi:hypothetical protein